jgi:hypothetical protein
MRIVLKIKRGFWGFKRYIFYLFDGSDLSKDMLIKEVDRKTWKKFDVGDYFDTHYHQFYTKEQATVNVK